MVGMTGIYRLIQVMTVNELPKLLDWGSVCSVIHLATNYGRDDDAEINNCNFNLPSKFLDLCNEYNVPAFLNADSFYSDLPESYSYLKEYRKSKRSFRDYAVENTSDTNATKFINLLIFHMYGLNDSPGKFVHDMLDLISKNAKDIDLTDGNQSRDFIYIDDVIEAFYSILCNTDRLEEGYSSFDVCTNN